MVVVGEELEEEKVSLGEVEGRVATAAEAEIAIEDEKKKRIGEGFEDRKGEWSVVFVYLVFG